MPRTIRPIRIEGNIAFVPLTRGLEAIIDATDVHRVERHNWHALKLGRVFYAGTTVRSKNNRTLLYLHSVVFGGKMVDHRDGDGLNNRQANLRAATVAQNQHNAQKRIDNKSGHKGVCWCKAKGMWRVEIRNSGKRRHLGYFGSVSDAAEAYRVASLAAHGAFSRCS